MYWKTVYRYIQIIYLIPATYLLDTMASESLQIRKSTYRDPI